MDLSHINVIFACDHAAFNQKLQIQKYLLESLKNIIIHDVGCNDTNSCDYPDFAKLAYEKYIELNKNAFIIVLCSTGIGISISMNRFEIDCCLVHNELEVEMAVNKIKAKGISLGGNILGQELLNDLSLKFIKLSII